MVSGFETFVITITQPIVATIEGAQEFASDMLDAVSTITAVAGAYAQCAP
jgi:hypothetical protein